MNKSIDTVNNTSSHNEDNSDETIFQITPYYAISITKLIIMSFSTFGFYILFWAYSNWQRIKQREETNIYPAMRALFFIFFCYSLLKRIKLHGEKLNITNSFSPFFITIGYILTSLSANLPSNVFLITFLSHFFFIPVQITANKINTIETPNHKLNNKFSTLNIIAIVLIGIPTIILIPLILFTDI